MVDFLLRYWELMLLVLTWAGIVVGVARRRNDWRHRRFEGQVNFSLTFIEQDEGGSPRLVLRTLLEDSAMSVWLNAWGVRLVHQAAEHTTPEQPILAFHDAQQQTRVNLAVLNVLSEHYSEAFLVQAMGGEVKTDAFLFAVTWERYGEAHDQKLRVLVVQRATLDWLFACGGAERVTVVVPHHVHRLRTLRAIYDELQAGNPDARVGEVVLGVKAAVAFRSRRLPE